MRNTHLRGSTRTCFFYTFNTTSDTEHDAKNIISEFVSVLEEFSVSNPVHRFLFLYRRNSWKIVKIKMRLFHQQNNVNRLRLAHIYNLIQSPDFFVYKFPYTFGSQVASIPGQQTKQQNAFARLYVINTVRVLRPVSVSAFSCANRLQLF